MEYTGKERRKFTRIQFENPVCLRNSLHAWDFQSLDISLKGILLKVPEDWLAKIGEKFQLELPLSNTQPNIFIRMEIKLVHREGEKAGFCWENIDINSFTHLHRLIEINLGESELMNREVSALKEFQQ